jgi:hypothetical protein
LIVSTNPEQRRLLLGVPAEFFHFVYGALLPASFFAQPLAFGFVALLLLALLFLLALVKS